MRANGVVAARSDTPAGAGAGCENENTAAEADSPALSCAVFR